MNRDGVANALVTIDTYHNRVHNGTMFVFTKRITGLADDASSDLILVNSSVIHAALTVHAGGASHLDLYQVGSYTGGSSYGAINQNAFKSDDWDGNFFHTASINTTLSTVYEDVIGDAGVHKGGGGAASGFAEFLLPAGIYGARITNKAGAAIDFSWTVNFYQPSFEP